MFSESQFLYKLSLCLSLVIGCKMKVKGLLRRVYINKCFNLVNTC